MSRYSRHIQLDEIGREGQQRLSEAKVLVIGAGGLGCPVLQYLTAAGIGCIGIIDFDIVEVSNLQRQILFGTSSLGMNKALAAKIRLNDLNPTICIKAYPEKLTSLNALDLFANYDLIVDGSDNYETRYLINDAAILTNKTVVYAGIYKFEGQVSVFNYQNGPSYRCLFPSPPGQESVASCSEIGVLGILPGIIGSMQANEVLKIVLGFDYILSGKLLCYDAKTAQINTLIVHKSDSEIEKVLAKRGDFINNTPDISCETEVQVISIEEAFKKENIQFIDVREKDELPIITMSNCIHIPLAVLDQNLDKIPSESRNIIFCKSGSRSKKAVEILQVHQFKNCYSLIGGASSLAAELNLKTS